MRCSSDRCRGVVLRVSGTRSAGCRGAAAREGPNSARPRTVSAASTQTPPAIALAPGPRTSASAVVHRSQHHHRDASIRGASLIGGSRWIYLPVQLPQSLPLLADRLVGPNAPGDTADRNRGRGMGAEIVVPRRMMTLPPVGRDYHQVVAVGHAQYRRRALPPRLRTSRCQHDHGNSRNPTASGVPASGEAVYDPIDVVQHPCVAPRHRGHGC